jgi:chromosome segregation ATPase
VAVSRPLTAKDRRGLDSAIKQMNEDLPVKVNRKGVTIAKAGGYSGEEQDKVFELEKQNLDMKQKENQLQQELSKLRTMIRRVEQLVQKHPGLSRKSKEQLLPEETERYIKEELGRLEKENEELRGRVKKLKALEKEASKPKGKTQGRGSAKGSGKLGDAQLKASEKKFREVVEQIKVKLIENENYVIKLTAKRDQLQTSSRGAAGGQLAQEIDRIMQQISQVNSKIAELRSDVAKDGQLFEDSAEFIRKKQEEIAQLQRDCEQI